MRIGIDGLPLLFQRSGTSTYTDDLVRHLRRLDQNDSVMLFARNQNLARTSYHSLSYKERLANYLYKEYQLAEKLIENRIDVYHSPQGMGLPKSSRLHCPCLMTLHDIILVLRARDYYSSIQAKIFEKRLLNRVKSVDHIITASNYSRNDILDWSGVDPSRVSVVYLGVSGKFKQVADAQSLEIARSRYQLPRRFILCLGSTEPRKNVRRAIEAFNHIKHKDPDYNLVIAGVDFSHISMRSAFKDLDLDRITMVGYIQDEDLAAIYSMADLLFFPSLYEGFGLPPLEAMACGTPVITSDNSSISEIAGDAAVLIDPLDTAQMATALEQVLTSDSKRDALIKRGRERVAKFSWEMAASQTREIYARLTRN